MKKTITLSVADEKNRRNIIDMTRADAQEIASQAASTPPPAVPPGGGETPTQYCAPPPAPQSCHHCYETSITNCCLYDTFTRTGSGGWGTADSGQTWTATTFGSGITYSTDGTSGVVDIAGMSSGTVVISGQRAHMSLSGSSCVGDGNLDAYWEWSADNAFYTDGPLWRAVQNPDGTWVPNQFLFPAGYFVSNSVYPRTQDVLQNLDFAIGGSKFMRIAMSQYDGDIPPFTESTVFDPPPDQPTPGAYWSINTPGVIASYYERPKYFNFSAGEVYAVRLRKDGFNATGQSCTYRVRMWKKSDPEPGSWDFEQTSFGNKTDTLTFDVARELHIGTALHNVWHMYEGFMGTEDCSDITLPYVTTALERNSTGYYYPLNTTVRYYVDVWVDGAILQPYVDYTTSGNFVVPTTPIDIGAKVTASYVVNSSVLPAGA